MFCNMGHELRTFSKLFCVFSPTQIQCTHEILFVKYSFSYKCGGNKMNKINYLSYFKIIYINKYVCGTKPPVGRNILGKSEKSSTLINDFKNLNCNKTSRATQTIKKERNKKERKNPKQPFTQSPTHIMLPPTHCLRHCCFSLPKHGQRLIN